MVLSSMSAWLPCLHAILVFFSMACLLYAVFIYVPTEREMGLVQRIFYFHVSSAFSAFLGFLLVFVGSIQYLRTRQARWDRLAVSGAELGVVFALIVLITGPIWARPIWGTYWRWEPRLTSMLILFAVYVAYLMVRELAPNYRAQRFAAVLGILAFVNIPLVYYSVYLWSPDQQLHPRDVSLSFEMQLTRYLGYLTFSLLFLYLVQRRIVLEKAANRLARIKQNLDSRPDISPRL